MADATTQQRSIASEKGAAAIADLKAKGHGLRADGRRPSATAVRKEMEARLWADFAKQYPATAPLFTAINNARA